MISKELLEEEVILECESCIHLVNKGIDGNDTGLCIGYEPHMVVDYAHSCKNHQQIEAIYEYQWAYSLNREKTIFKLSSHTTESKPETAYYSERFEPSKRILKND